MMVTGSHDAVLVALSVLIAAAASYTALDLAARVPSASGRPRYGWLVPAAAVMGGGIWSMHFLAMQALRMPVPTSYDAGLTALSLLIAIGFTGIGFAIVTRPGAGRVALAASGLVMGSGIAAMHYTGMAAMRMPATVVYDPALVVLSVAVAVGASMVALALASKPGGILQKLVAAVAMGFAVSGMHYTGMAAASFAAHNHPIGAAQVPAHLGHASLAIAIAGVTLAILFFASLTAMFDRRIAQLAERDTAMLRDSERRFRTLYRRTPLPLCSVVADGRIEQVSDSWLELLGFPREAVIGRPFADFMVEDSEDRGREDWLGALAAGNSRSECRLRTAAGQAIDAELSVSLQRDDAGRFVRALCGVIDVTARKQAEGALHQAQKVELLGQLTGGIAHDFNNVLAIVLGSLEPLRRRVAADPQSVRLLDNAVEGAKRGKALTERMLAFARRQDLKPSAVNVPELVLGMAELLRRSIGPSVQIEARFPLDLPRAYVDANQLELALANLAINARDAMPRGGRIRIGGRVAEVRSPEEGLAPGTYLCLYVRDQGDGMDAATLARATEPFFTTKGAGKGTGLGLSMVQGFAAHSGGRLVLRSREGQGTTAEIWLPVASAARDADPAPRTGRAPRAPAGAPRGRPAKVLLVDDDALVLMGAAAMVEDLGHAAVTARSGREALDALRAHPDLDLVVTDQAMPAMSGTELAAAISAERPGLPVLLASGCSDLPAETATGRATLAKPFDQRALADAIAACAPRRGTADRVVRLHAS